VTKTVPVHVAETHLSELVAEVEAGGDVVIARGDTPVVRLVPVAPSAPKRTFGSLAGKIGFDDGFFDPLPEEELEAWNG